MKIKHSLYLLLLIYSFNLFAQQKEKTLFSLGQVRLYYEKYKWGNELYLKFAGKAHRVLHGASVIASLEFRGKRVFWREIYLTLSPKQDTIIIKKTWGPLNKPYQKTLAGRYKFSLVFDINSQHPKIRQKIQRAIGRQNTVKNSYRTITFGTRKKSKEEDKQIKTFYKAQIIKVYRMYRLLHRTLKLKNREERTLESLKTWQRFLHQYIEELEKEIGIFRKFHKKIYCSRYPKSKAYLGEYYSLLLRLAKIYNIHVFKKHKMKLRNFKYRIDTFGIMKVGVLKTNLKNYLRSTIKDLRLSKREILRAVRRSK